VTTSTRERTAPTGGSFMIGPAEAGSVFTPERLSDEHRAMRDAVKTFVEREVGRQREAVEGKDYATHRSLLERLGKDGYLGIDIPEQYGGAGLDRISSLVVNEAISTAGSFAVTYSAHTGIGTLPLVFFGSDAMAIRTRATQQPDGSWRLDGSKQFITNAAFADLFTVYAKIDGEQFSAFLVERSTPGLSIGPEEHKMGLHGASTCPVTLDGVVVPAENLRGEPLDRVALIRRVAATVIAAGGYPV